MRKKSKTNFKIIIAITTLLITMFSTISFATGNLSTLDITPPRGKLEIQNMTQIDNINYVDSANVTFEVTAFDDICEPTEIKYYYSLTEIVDEPPMWYDYAPGNTHDITLTNPSGTNTIYAVFKDNVGNTSLIYGDTGYKVQYNKNADDAVMFTSTVATTGYYGMGFMVTMQTPTRDGYYFAGWSTSPDATEVNFKKGEIIPADTFVGGGKTINLYAVWSQSTNGAVLLADVAEIGDYVNYPVTYDNVPSYNNSYISKYNGWRVISKNVDLDGVDSPGTVNLVSAGVPLTFKPAAGTATATKLTNDFLSLEFNDAGTDTYYKTGFLYSDLKDTFRNKFTALKTDGTTPMVRGMNKEDIFRITGHTAMATGTTMKLSDAKWEQLFVNGAYYYLASAASSSYLWYVYYVGYVDSYNSSEYGIRPVVSLKSTVIATGQDAVGAWNIEVAG